MLGALIRPIFNQDDHEQARDRLSEAVAHLDGTLPKVAAMLEEAEEDVLAFYAFPSDHQRKIRSTDESVKGSTRLIGPISGDRSVAMVSRRAADRLPWARFRWRRRKRPVWGVARPSSARRRVRRWPSVGVRLRSGRGRPRAKCRVWGYEPCRAACPVVGLESRAPLAAATPFFGVLACQSATIWA